MTVWSENLHKEAQTWDRWFSNPERADARNHRIALVNKPSPLLKMVSVPVGETIRIIDIGSGPIGTVGRGSLHQPVEVIYADALANEYNEILDRHGLSEVPRITPLKGEELERQFGQQAFHIVNCANALDHFEDPRLAFVNMYAVCKTHGLLCIVSFENEGVREKYSGLHQWNLRADDRGIWLASRRGVEENLLEVIDPVEYSWCYKAQNPTVFEALIKKLH